MKLEEGEYLAHYGILRKSGRYPWGSGKTPLQRSKSFLDIVDEYKRQGMSDSDIAKLFDIEDEKGKPTFTSRHVRALRSRSVHIQKQEQIRQAQALKDKGMGYSAIARQMHVNESTVRSLLEPGRLDRLNVLQNTTDMLKRQVEEKGIIDVGAHVQRDLPIGDNPDTRIGISKDKFETALIMLQEEGYAVTTVPIPQLGTGEKTTRRVLLKPPKPNMTPREIQKHAWTNRENVQLIAEKSNDGGRNFESTVFQKPLNVDSKRVGVRFKEDGGAEADGVIFVRPGVKDLSLGKSHYAQVRIAVDGTHYLKGMAIYKNDLPTGVDLMFNTNKSNTGDKMKALKPLNKIPLRDKDGNIVKKDGKAVDSDKVDWTNPFGAFPKIDGGQILDAKGNVTSAMNILNAQGDWATWSKNLSRQVLSKQTPEFAESQLALTYERRRQEFEELKALTNPLIKRTLLESFSDEVDSSAVHLKATSMPYQATKVILPAPSMKPDEIFAPQYKNGERVALVRFPHAGRFEIPELTVNNRNREAQNLFKDAHGVIQAPDAVGIHPKVAERLSGADFDGDHVVVIPNNKGIIKSDPALEGLKGFDPQKYKVPTPEEDPKNGWTTVAKDSKKQQEMGKITNLISDMTIQGASPDELARAVRHSMVVIDSEKHNLDYKASEREHGILALKREYQGVNPNGQPKGASTLITKATSDARPLQRKAAASGPGRTRWGNMTIDNKTGEKLYDLKGDRNQKGELKTFRSRKLAEEKDAFKLVSEHGGLPIERVYAEHSNKLKALANEARKELVDTELKRRNASSAEVYKAEVASLKSKLNEALKNAPHERQAQNLANFIVAQRKRANPDMEKSEEKKIKGQALEAARERTGAKKDRIPITDREWQAIQNGAVSIETLKNVLRNTDVDKLKERATPRSKPVMTPVMTTRAKTMLRSGATVAEVAETLGISVSTIQSVLADGG
jgi:hypothetical protein